MQMEERKALGAKLKLFCAQEGIPLNKMAERIGIHYVYLYQICRGKRIPSEMLLIRCNHVMFEYFDK